MHKPILTAADLPKVGEPLPGNVICRYVVQAPPVDVAQLSGRAVSYFRSRRALAMACRIDSEPMSRPSTNAAQAARSAARMATGSMTTTGAVTGVTGKGAKPNTFSSGGTNGGVMTAGAAGLVEVRFGMSEEYTIYSTAARFPRLTGRALAGAGHPPSTLTQPCDFLRSGT